MMSRQVKRTPPPPQDSIDEECLFDSKAPRSELMDELN